MLLVPLWVQSQSRAMQFVAEQHDDAFTMVFYYSTLKMWLPEDEVELKKIIHDVEKIKMLKFDEDDIIDSDELSKIKELLIDQDYEEMMIIKGPSRNLLIYIREGKGIFMLGGMGSESMALDILGTIPINKLLTLQEKIQTLTADGSIIDSIRDLQSN